MRVAAAVAAVLLVSCGSDGDGGEPTASADTGADQTTPAAVGTTAGPPDDVMSEEGPAVDEPATTAAIAAIAAIAVDPSALPTDPSIDAWATVPTPDGQFIAVRVHGTFGTDGRALDGALDPAALGLADNLVGRL